MGFRLSSFISGAAKGAADILEEDEATASKSAAFGVKALKENYDKVQAENRKLETEVSENIKVLRTFDKTATEAELFAAATNKAYMSMAVEAAKSNPATFKVGDVVKIKKDNPSEMTAMDMLKTYTTIPAVSKAARQAEGVTVEDDTNFISRLRKDVSSRAASKAEEQTAKAMGVSIEQLRAASGFTRPEMDTGAEFDFTSMQPAKSFNKQEEEAKSKLLDATRKGDPQEVSKAEADLLIFKYIKDTLTPEQTQFSNKVADIKNRYMFGDAETRKAAKPEYDKLMADIRAEAMAKKTGEGAGTGASEKIPALGTLNTFTSAAVARAVAGKHGDLIKSKQLAIVEKADGSVGIDYIGDNETLRRQILETQANAARNALSLYTDAKGQPFNRDVASVLNSYTSVVPSVVRQDSGTTPPAAKPAPTATTPAVRNFTSVAEAEKAKLPKGTRITINGRPAEVQ
jgi:hypothetical protein